MYYQLSKQITFFYVDFPLDTSLENFLSKRVAKITYQKVKSFIAYYELAGDLISIDRRNLNIKVDYMMQQLQSSLVFLILI